jgi:predicted RNA-binding Zn-ribbon protein involved in translation (DUF1610 family)
MIVAEPKKEYEVTTYVRPLCPKCGKGMNCLSSREHVRYFYCLPCGESKTMPKYRQSAE